MIIKCAKITNCEEQGNLVYEAKGCKNGELFSSPRLSSEPCSENEYVKVGYRSEGCTEYKGKTFCQADSVEGMLDYDYIQSDCLI